MIPIPSKGVLTAIGGVLVYMYREELKQLLMCTCQYIIDYFCCIITIKHRTNEKLIYAINQELNDVFGLTTKKKIATDGLIKPNYKIANGQYKLCHNNKNIYLDISDDTTKLWVYGFSTDISFLQNYMDSIYQKYSTTENVIIYYTSEKNDWSYPIYRRPREIKRITAEMQKMLDDVEDFYKPETEKKYETQSKAYRRGYLVTGITGTGKSSIVEIITKKYNMSVYLLNLNSSEMTDSILINLVATIPPKSLLVLDEFHQQYDEIKKNNKIRISSGGILNAIDGPQRMSHGTIVILLANDISNLDDTFKTPLLRKGRIDMQYTFTEAL